MHDSKNNRSDRHTDTEAGHPRQVNDVFFDDSVVSPDRTDWVMRHNSKAFTRMALIAGIVSVILGFCPYISLVPAAIAIVLSIVVIRRKHATTATRIALICGIVGAVLFFLEFLFLILYLALDDATLRTVFERFGVDFDIFNNIYKSR